MGRRGGGGRSRGSPFGRSRTTTSRSSSYSPKPVPTTKSHSTSTKSQQTTQKPQQTTSPQQTSGGGGFFSSLMGSTVGSMAGMYMAHKLFSPSTAPETNAAIDKEFGQCSAPFKNFLECLENNPDNIANCQWSYTTFFNCQKG